MAEIGDVVRCEESCGVVVAKKGTLRAVRWEPVRVTPVQMHEEQELNVVRRLNRPQRRRSTAKPMAVVDEPAFFALWLGHHVTRCAEHGIQRSTPRPGTSYRAGLANTFAALLAEGYELEDFQLASDGVLADEFMRSGGHTAPENVLRKTKIAKRIDEGRAWRAAQENDKYARFG